MTIFIQSVLQWDILPIVNYLRTRLVFFDESSSGARAKIWSNFTTRQAYLLQHSYSKAPVELEPKFGQILQLDKPNTTEQLLQGSSGAEPTFGQILQQDMPTYYSTATPTLQ